MGDDTHTHDEERDGQLLDWSRRNLLKITGIGAGLAALGGVNTAAGQDGGGQTPTPDDGDGEDDGGPDGQGANQVHTVETMITGPPTNTQRPADFFYQPTGIHIQPGDVLRYRFVTPDHNVVSYHPAFGMRRRVPVGVDSFSAPIHGWTDDSIADDQVDPPAEMGGDGEGDGEDGGETPGDTPGTPATTTAPGTTTGGGETGDPEGPTAETWLHAFDTPGVYDILCSPHEAFGMAMRVVVGDETEAPFETSDPANLPEPRAGPVGLAREVLTDPALEPSNIVTQGQVSWQSLQANQPTGTTTDGGGGM